MLLLETFETPTLSAGGSTSSLPSGWLSYSGPSVVQSVFHPTGVTRFKETAPLESPAGGNQLLMLGRTNSGVYRMSGTTILGGGVYAFSAAIGNSLLEDSDQFWSLQLWADSNDNGFFDPGDSFLGQQFGTSGTATLAAPGEWAVNQFVFDSSTNPAVVGKELILFLNNYGDALSESYYDQVLLQAIPEPNRAMLLLLGGLLLGLRRKRG